MGFTTGTGDRLMGGESRRHICLVSPGHITSNPRLVKEADALTAAGDYQVTVIASQKLNWLAEFDQKILEQAKWRYIGLRPHRFELAYKILRKLAITLSDVLTAMKLSTPAWLAERAHQVDVSRLKRLAGRVKADLYVAHNLAALPAVAFAAQSHQALYAFDAEDSHVDELEDTPANRAERHRRSRIEAKYLPGAAYVSAASPGIAAALRARYQVDPKVILNTFPLSHATDTAAMKDAGMSDGVSVYWFSQTIGPGRGLEAFIRIASQLTKRVELSLLGLVSSAYRDQLEKLAGDRVDLVFQGLADADQMVGLSAGYHAGLSLEQNQPVNRAVCLTNKIFTYLLAGTPVILSDTPAQRSIARKLGRAAVVIDLGDKAESVTRLNKFFSDESSCQAAARRAFRLGRKRYNWDCESQRYLRLIERALQH